MPANQLAPTAKKLRAPAAIALIALATAISGCGSSDVQENPTSLEKPPLTVPQGSVAASAAAAKKTGSTGTTSTTTDSGTDTTDTGTDTGGADTGTDTGGADTGTGTDTGTNTGGADTGGAGPGN